MGIIVNDLVVYAVWGNQLVNKFFVRPDREKIFAYRSKQLEKIFYQD